MQYIDEVQCCHIACKCVFFSARQTALTNAVNIQAKVRPFRNECPNNSDGRDGEKMNVIQKRIIFDYCSSMWGIHQIIH